MLIDERVYLLSSGVEDSAIIDILLRHVGVDEI